MTPRTVVQTLARAFGVFRRRLLSGFAWNLVSIFALQGSMLLTSIVVARLIGLEAFGIYALTLSTVVVITGIAQGSSGLVATKFVAENLAGHPLRVARVLRLCALAAGGSGLAFAALLWATAPLVAGQVLNKPGVEASLRWAAVAVAFNVLVAYQHGALQGFGAFRRLGIGSAFAGALHLAASVLGAALNGLEGAVQGLVVAGIGRAGIVSVALRLTLREHDIPRPTRIEREDWQPVWAFALPASLAGFITLPCLWAVTLLVTRQPDGLAWMALFAVAHQVRQVVLQLPSLLNVVTFAELSRVKGAGDEAAFRQVFRSTLLLGAGFTALVVAVLSLLAEPVLALFGTGFLDGRMLLLVLLLSTLPEALANTTYQLVQSHGRMWHSLLFIALPRDAGYVGLAGVLLATWGLTGAGVAYLAAQVLGLVLTVAVVRLIATAPRPAGTRAG